MELVFFGVGDTGVGDGVFGVGDTGVGDGVFGVGLEPPFKLFKAKRFVKNNSDNNNKTNAVKATVIPSNFSFLIFDNIKRIKGFIIRVGTNNKVNTNAYDVILDQVFL